jgi:hypothetical protein
MLEPLSDEGKRGPGVPKVSSYESQRVSLVLGADCRNRTDDLLLTRQPLYLLS